MRNDIRQPISIIKFQVMHSCLADLPTHLWQGGSQQTRPASHRIKDPMPARLRVTVNIQYNLAATHHSPIVPTTIRPGTERQPIFYCKSSYPSLDCLAFQGSSLKTTHINFLAQVIVTH